jgi:DNA-binding winged helix-turn-helix (wHTH) protein
VNYEANVNTTVNKLRLALGDSPGKPMYVETIPRQGYRFLGNVERASGMLTIVAADVVGGRAAQQDASLTIASKMIRGTLAELFAKGPGAAILLCGVLIGVGIVLLMYWIK